jgi:hypothetical protein
MSSSNYNPYQPPQANLTLPPSQQDGEFIEGGQSVPFSNVTGWIGTAWELFKQSPGIWILILIIMFVISIVMSIIPIAGALANSLITPAFMGGLILGCKAIDSGEPLEVAHLFAGFNKKAGDLMLIGLLQIACFVGLAIVLVVAGIVIFGSGILHSFGDPNAVPSFIATQGIKLILALILAMMLLGIPIAMAFWFAPALVVLQNMSPTTAIVQSFKGCRQNFFQLFFASILFVLLFILGCIPILLGLLVVVPMLYCSVYAAYKDIYLQR